MQRKKILIACLSVLLVLALPAASIPRAHAFVSTPSVTVAGLAVSGFTDPLTGVTTTGIATGAVLTVNVYMVASSVVYQRNVTVGFKGDWMNTYQNATNASPTSTLSLTAGQTATISIAVTMPTSGGITAHSWTVALWNGASNSLNAATCSSGNFFNEKTPPSCGTVSNFSAGYSALAIYTGDQLSGAQANVQAESAITNANAAIALVTGGLLKSAPPGSTAAAGQIAQANSEDALGDQSWTNGDYSGAKNHYQNALNDANAAVSTLAGQGGADNANLVNLLLGGTGIALIGIGALFAGLGAMFYLRKKSKA
jgi:uncharacterized membrane protein